MGIITKILLFPFWLIKFIILDIINDLKTIKRVFKDLSEGRNPMPPENLKALTTGWGEWFKKVGFMYIIICIAFYTAGYQAASNNLQDECNKFIIETYTNCKIDPYNGDEWGVINITIPEDLLIDS